MATTVRSSVRLYPIFTVVLVRISVTGIFHSMCCLPIVMAMMCTNLFAQPHVVHGGLQQSVKCYPEPLDFSGSSGRWDIPRAAYGDPSGNAVTCDRWVEDGSYLKLRSVSLNYNVPLRDRSGFIKGIDVFVNANNLFTVTGYSGFDPEVFSSVNPLLRGVDTGASPVPRSYIFGIKLSL